MTSSPPAGTPTGPDLAGRLRLEVGRFRARESRRVFDTRLTVGVPGEPALGTRDTFVVRRQDLPAVDVGLRTDVVAALLEQTPAEARWAWLTRPGDVEPADEDAAWHAAARVAFAMHGRPLAGFYVLTRGGWRDVRTGAQRVWKRLRL